MARSAPPDAPVRPLAFPSRFVSHRRISPARPRLVLAPAALSLPLLLAPQRSGAQAADTARADTARAAGARADTARRAAVLAPVVAVGTRFNGRVVLSSPVPVDLVSRADLTVGGYTDLQRMLKARVPTFSLPASTAAGTSDFVNAPTLRGLGIGQMLVLVNGKRRHTTGDVTTHQQIGRGDVGYDFNAIPAAALRQVEVLRDGAAAQYGSDAIAGVVNLVLDRTTGARAEAVAGRTERGDGDVLDLSAGYGVALPGDGVLRATLYWQDHAATNRALPDTRQQYFSADGTRLPSPNFGSGVGTTPSNGPLDPREATIDRMTFRFGSPRYVNQGVFLNADAKVGRGATAYAFGGASELDGDSPAFFRRPAQDETVRGLHPDGFLPVGAFTFRNRSLAAGVRGFTAGGMSWDLSSVAGASLIDNRYGNTNNASLGAASPTEVYRGGTRFTQWTTNLDVTRSFALGDRAPLRAAAGVEHRREYYRIVPGEPASYEGGGAAVLDGPNRGRPAPVGVQPSSGYRAGDATRQQRSNNAAYVDLEREMTARWLLSAAARYEDYSDFGSTATYKVATRVQLPAGLAVRGSLNSGFRAPHLAQSWFGNSSGTIVNGALATLQLLPVSAPAARVLGAAPLRPERSVNQSVGLIADRGALSLTLDAFRIRVADRIALSSTFTGAAVTTLLANAGYPGIVSATFLTNAVDTDTRGAELTARWRRPLGRAGLVTTTLGAMYNASTFDRVARAPRELTALGITTPLFDVAQQVRFTTSQPRDKVVLGVDWTWRRLALNVTNIRYGQYEALQFTSLTPERAAVVARGFRSRTVPTDPASANVQVIQQFDPRTLTDVEAAVRVRGGATLSVGVNNLFDVYPTRNFPSTAASVAAGTNGADNFGTLPYNYASPHDWNGRFLVTKLRFGF